MSSWTQRHSCFSVASMRVYDATIAQRQDGKASWASWWHCPSKPKRLHNHPNQKNLQNKHAHGEWVAKAIPTVAVKKGETGRHSPRTPLESMLWLKGRTAPFELFSFMFAGHCFASLNIESGERGAALSPVSPFFAPTVPHVLASPTPSPPIISDGDT